MALNGIDLTSIGPALEIIYDHKSTKLQAYRNNPLFAMIPKGESFDGEAWHIRLWTGVDEGMGSTITAARANQSAAKVNKFKVTDRKKKYSVLRIEREAMKASGGAHSFLDGLKMLGKTHLYNMGRDISLDLYRDGSASRGQVGSLNSTTITLANKQNIVHFEVGMRLVATNGSDPTNALQTGGTAIMTVQGVDRANGTVDVDGVPTTPGLSAGDHLIRYSFDYATNSKYQGLAGVGAWIPATVTPADFFGVDRTEDTTRLGGLRYDGSGLTVEDAILDAGALCFQEGAQPDMVFGNPVHEVDLVKSLGSKAEYMPVRDAEGIVGFESVKVRTAAGTVKWVSDPNCPPGVAYMLTLNTWKLNTLGPAPHLVKDDGLVIRRIDGEDAYESQFALYGEVGCYAPSHNCRITLDT